MKVVRKTKKTVAVKTKTSAKSKIKKIIRKTPTATKKKVTVKSQPKLSHTPEAVVFGLLEKEVKKILNEDQYQAPAVLEREVKADLKELLSDKELVKENNLGRHYELVVESTGGTKNHSPFVLDLSALAEKKRQMVEKKAFLRNYFNNQPATITEEDILEKKETISPNEKEDLGVIYEISELDETTIDLEDQFTGESWFTARRLPTEWRRTVVIFMVMCLMVILPIKTFSYYSDLKDTRNKVLNHAQKALGDLQSAKASVTEKDYDGAVEKINSANSSFAEAQKRLNSIDVGLKQILKILPNNGANLADAEYLLAVGETMTAVGTQLAELPKSFAKEDENLVASIRVLKERVDNILPQLNAVSLNLNKVRPVAIPEDKRAQFLSLRETYAVLLSDLKELSDFSIFLSEILGADYDKRYLLIFQNSNELRATGGFMGSLALLDLDRGEIENLEVPGGGPYDFQGSLKEVLNAPYPLTLINGRWEMQDANWFPDFPTSAQKIMWFYEKAGGPTVDGVIAINSDILAKLLKVTGPISLPSYNKTFTADNFAEELQKAVEFEYDKEVNRPKQIIGDMAPVLMERILASRNENILTLATILKESLRQRDIQMYFSDEDIQNKLSAYGWTGEIKDTSKDYLAVINTNIGGYKTDAYIKQEQNLKVEIDAQGKIVNTLILTREHTGKLDSVFGSKSNIDYVRVYVPEGSRLISASGFSDIPASSFESSPENAKDDVLLETIQGKTWVEAESKTMINNEFGKTVFANWIQTDPGEISTVIIKYELPFVLDLQEQQAWTRWLNKAETQTFYSLYWQKQSGSKNIKTNFNLQLPQNKKILWSYDNKHLDSAVSTWSGTADEDKFTAITF